MTDGDMFAVCMFWHETDIAGRVDVGKTAVLESHTEQMHRKGLSCEVINILYSVQDLFALVQ